MSSKSAEWTLAHSAAEWAMLKNFDGLPYFLTCFPKIDSTTQISWVWRGYAPTAPLAIIEKTNKNLPKSCLPALLTWVSTFYKHIQRHIGWLKISDDAQLRLTAASLKPYCGTCGGLPSPPPHRLSHPCEWLAPWCPWRCNPIAICSNWRSGACRGPAHPFVQVLIRRTLQSCQFGVVALLLGGLAGALFWHSCCQHWIAPASTQIEDWWRNRRRNQLEETF